MSQEGANKFLFSEEIDPGARHRAKALVFSDASSQRLLDQIELIADSDVSVLIQGETGTGKELVARHLHARSGRRGPFVAVNCGAFAEHLIESELFGHEAGAFTGAIGKRAGWFEAAHKGSLFLDEIGDLPMSMQVKLLRVLQEREVVRIGSRTTIPVDVRLITATNVDLTRAVANNRFRMDLYYRVAVASLELPPLRERPGDIEPLVRHFATTHARQMQREAPQFSADALAALRRHPWPGNIRELENTIQIALLVSKNGVVREQDLRFPAGDTLREAAALPAAPGEALENALEQLLDVPQDQLFATVEGSLLRLALQQTGGNQVRTAHKLGLSRNVLRTLLKRHGLL